MTLLVLLFQFQNTLAKSTETTPGRTTVLVLMDDNPRMERRYSRYNLETELRATTLGTERREIRGRCLNINQGGIAGLFTAGWDVGTAVSLQFSVPVTTTPVRVRGIVRNRAGYRYGFEFVGLALQEQEIISWTCRTLDLLH